MKKADLQEALEIVKPGLANKELIEQTTSFAFIKGRVVTYNDEISISHPVEGLKLSGAVEAKELYALLTKVKKEELEITEEEGEILITSGRMKSGLTLKKEILLPLEEVVSKKDWYKLPTNLLKHMAFAARACSRDMSRPLLTCVHINKAGFVEGTDGFRIARGQLEEALPIRTILIPATSVLEVIKFDPIEISDGSGWVHFRTEAGSVLSCRILTEAFPKTAHLLEVKGKKIKFPKGINELLEKATIFSERNYVLDESVTVILVDNRMTIKSKSESGWYEEEVNAKYSGDKISFSITPYLLKGILSEMHECIYTKNALLFEGENWQYLSMLRAE